MVIIIDLLHIQYCNQLFQKPPRSAKFEIDTETLTCLNKRSKLSVSDGGTYGPTLIVEKLRL